MEIKNEKVVLGTYAAATRLVGLRPEEKEAIRTRLLAEIKKAPRVVLPQVRKPSFASRFVHALRRVLVRA